MSRLRIGRIVDGFKDVQDYELYAPGNGKRYCALERAVASGAQIRGQQYLAGRTVDRGGIGHRSSPSDRRNGKSDWCGPLLSASGRSASICTTVE